MSMLVNGKEIDYSRLPLHMQYGFMLWIEYGIKPGDFGWAVITNNLFNAYNHADHTNLARMKDIIMFFYNDAPSQCYGSLEKAKMWIESKNEGLEISTKEHELGINKI